MKTIFYKIYKHLTVKGFKNFNEIPNVDDWRAFINNLPKPITSLQRSLNKYHCRMYYFGFLYKLLINIAAIGAIIVKVLPTFIHYNPVITKVEADAVLVEDFSVDYHDILPEDLKRYSKTVIVKNQRSKFQITNEAKTLFISIWKKNFYKPHFVYWAFRELAFFSELVDVHSPKAIIVYVNERNAISPILKEYLESKKVKFITFMHGDYILQLIQGFMDFSEFYVWDAHYIEMFVNDLHCPPDQFKVYLPKKLTKKFDNSNEVIDLTYFFGSESDLTVKRLSKLFREFKAKGLKCRVRPHPRRQNRLIERCFDKDQIEDTQNMPIKKSIEQSKYIVALNSTVLLEAYHGGKKVIIDDWTDRNAFLSIQERKSIMLSKPHLLLSDYIKNNLERDGRSID